MRDEMASAAFYKSPKDRITFVLARIDAVQAELDAALERWVELDAGPAAVRAEPPMSSSHRSSGNAQRSPAKARSRHGPAPSTGRAQDAVAAENYFDVWLPNLAPSAG